MTDSQKLRDKIGYMGHHHYLPQEHRWHNNKAAFNEKVDHHSESSKLSREQLLQWLKHLEDVFDKFGKHPSKRKQKHGSGEGIGLRRVFFLSCHVNKNSKLGILLMSCT